MSAVEWKPLGELVKRNKGISITAGQMSELNSRNGNVRVFAAGQTIADIDKDNLPHNCAYKLPSIIVKSRGYIDFEFYDKPFTHKNEMWSYSFTNKDLGKFIYYYLTTKTDYFRNKAKANSVKLPQLCVADTDNYLIPIPSLAKQQEIVSHLDTFTTLISNLESELDMRRKQYEHYRNQLYGDTLELLLEKADKGEIKVSTLSEIGTFTRGRRFVRTDIMAEGTPCIHYGDMYTYYGVSAKITPTFLLPEVAAKLRFAQENDVVIVGAGENNEDIGIGVAWLGKEDVAVHDACYIFKHQMNPLYISYYLRTDIYHKQIKKHVSSGKICSISSDGIGKSLIPIPSLATQQEIVSKLDAFENLIQSLEQEIKLRKQQYEYYREKLLTFE